MDEHIAGWELPATVVGRRVVCIGDAHEARSPSACDIIHASLDFL